MHCQDQCQSNRQRYACKGIDHIIYKSRPELRIPEHSNIVLNSGEFPFKPVIICKTDQKSQKYRNRCKNKKTDKIGEQIKVAFHGLPLRRSAHFMVCLLFHAQKASFPYSPCSPFSAKPAPLNGTPARIFRSRTLPTMVILKR